MKFKQTWALSACMAGMVVTTAAAQVKNRGGAEVSLNRGIQSFTAEDYETARRHFEASLARDPDFAAPHYFLGLTLLQSASETSSQSRKRALLERAVAEFGQARLRDPQMILPYLDAAIAQTILGRFEAAESGFQAFLKERPNDPLPYLFLAVAHYRQAKEDPAHLPQAMENLDKAEQALQRSGRVDRSLEAHTKFYRGLVYLQQRNREAAREALQEGYDLAPDSDIGLKSKEILDQLVGRRPWELSLRMGFDYDTNVTLRGNHVQRRINENTGADWRFGLGSAFTYRIVETDEFLLGVGGSTFNTWHAEIDDFDVQNYGANVYMAYTPADADWLTLSVRYDWDFTLVGNQSFLGRHRMTPQIDVRETDWTNTSLFYQFDVRNYYNQPSDRRLDRDGDTHVLGVIQRFEVAEMYDRPFTIDVSYRFENVDTRGTEFTSDNHVFSLGVGVPLPWDLTFDFVSEFEVQHYKQRSLFDFDRSRRRDFIYTFLFALTKQFNEHVSARFAVNTTNEDSNIRDQDRQEFFSFDRITYGLSVLYRF